MTARRIFKILMITFGSVFLLTVMLVAALRWVNPPVTAYMLETRSHLSDKAGHPVALRQQWVSIDQIAGVMPLAAVASEDQTFPTNWGFDWSAIQKAIHYNRHHRHLHGASTITQQTAKNLFLWSGKSYFRKALGAYFTVLIDTLWPKRRVLEVYLNIAQFDPRVFGIKAAAAHFFSERPAHLSAAQAALLAATLPAPDAYSVTDPSQYMRHRQHWIINQMYHLGDGYLTGVGLHPAHLPAHTSPARAKPGQNPLPAAGMGTSGQGQRSSQGITGSPSGNQSEFPQSQGQPQGQTQG